MRICRVATVPFFLQHHLREQITYTVVAGHCVTLVSGDGPEVADLKNIPGVEFVCIDIPRAISLWRDWRALWRLFWLFRQGQYDIVHSTTPKAGMLCAVAGMMARVPVRIHTYTGQPWVELRGFIRRVAMAGDWITAHFNTKCYADSMSQRNFLVKQGIAEDHKIAVVGKGSLAGVDVARFDSQKWTDRKEALRAQIGIPGEAIVITFIGRLTRDKGVTELVQAFTRLADTGRSYALLLVGPQEPERDPLPQETLESIQEHPDIFAVGYSSEPERYLAMTDIFCLPSYREGFGNVVIEAAAMGIPTIGTRIVGLSDAVVDGETGILVPPKNVDELVSGLQSLIDAPALRIAMGERAKDRAIRYYDSKKVNIEVVAEYSRLMREYEGNAIL